MNTYTALIFIYCFVFVGICIMAAPPVAPLTRIVGGEDAVLGQIPYQASLSIAGVPTCGAVVLSDRYALTSLQCVCSAGSDKPWPPQMFTITAGTIDLYSGGLRIPLQDITINPNYSTLTLGIALLKLSQPLALLSSSYMAPIALSQVNPPLNAVIEISGWGRTADVNSNMHRTLQINDATVLNSHDCSKTIGHSAKDIDVVCLVNARKNGICQGDFGGPAVYRGKLVGIAAAVVGECGSMLPDVFTSVAANYNWIVENMKE